MSHISLSYLMYAEAHSLIIISQLLESVCHKLIPLSGFHCLWILIFWTSTVINNFFTSLENYFCTFFLEFLHSIEFFSDPLTNIYCNKQSFYKSWKLFFLILTFHQILLWSTWRCSGRQSRPALPTRETSGNKNLKF